MAFKIDRKTPVRIYTTVINNQPTTVRVYTSSTPSSTRKTAWKFKQTRVR